MRSDVLKMEMIVMTDKQKLQEIRFICLLSKGDKFEMANEIIKLIDSKKSKNK